MSEILLLRAKFRHVQTLHELKIDFYHETGVETMEKGARDAFTRSKRLGYIEGNLDTDWLICELKRKDHA